MKRSYVLSVRSVILYNAHERVPYLNNSDINETLSLATLNPSLQHSYDIQSKDCLLAADSNAYDLIRMRSSRKFSQGS